MLPCLPLPWLPPCRPPSSPFPPSFAPPCSFYFCSLQKREDLADFDAAAGGAGGLLGGPLSWLAGAWASIKNAAAQQQLAGHLRQFLRHSGGREALAAAGAHMQVVLAAAGGLADGGADGGAAAEEAGEAASAPPTPGVEILGLRSADASRISPQEWADLVAAAAASAADAVAPALPASLPASATRRTAEAAVTAALCGSGGGGTNSGGGSEGDAAYLSRLAAALADARSLLQHSAAALYLLPTGPGRRHLQAASASLQRQVEGLTPLLLALPEREELRAPPPAHEAAQAATAARTAAGPAAAQPQEPRQQQHKQREAAPAGGGGGLAGWLLRKLYGVEVPAAAGLAREQRSTLSALPPAVLLQQVQFASAVHQQRACVRAELLALEEEAAALRAAARSGLYCSDSGGGR